MYVLRACAHVWFCLHDDAALTRSRLARSPREFILLSIMIVNELTVFASLTVRFLRGVCQVLRSAQRLPALHALFLCQVLFC